MDPSPGGPRQVWQHSQRLICEHGLEGHTFFVTPLKNDLISVLLHSSPSNASQTAGL